MILHIFICKYIEITLVRDFRILCMHYTMTIDDLPAIFINILKKKNYLDNRSMFYDNYFCGLFAVVKNWCKSEDTRDIKIQKYILLLPCFEWEIRGIICGTKNVGECKGCHEKKSFSNLRLTKLCKKHPWIKIQVCSNEVHAKSKGRW